MLGVDIASINPFLPAPRLRTTLLRRMSRLVHEASNRKSNWCILRGVLNESAVTQDGPALLTTSLQPHLGNRALIPTPISSSVRSQ
jgi:hypothetical protein